MATAKSKSAQSEAEKYVRFIKSVHLTFIGLDSASLKIDRELLEASPPPENAVIEVIGRHEVSKMEEGAFAVQGHHKITIRAANGSEAIEISCVHRAAFSIDHPAERANVERFSTSEVRLVFWPYLRQFVAESTAQMAINPPLLLPLTTEIRQHSAESKS